MKAPNATTCVLFGTLLGSPALVIAQSSDRSHPAALLKDSIVTTMIKTKLAAEHLASLERIHVETDTDGVVWLSGNATSAATAAKAITIARATEHVRAVHSEIRIKPEDGDRDVEGVVGLSLVLALLSGADVTRR